MNRLDKLWFGGFFILVVMVCGCISESARADRVFVCTTVGASSGDPIDACESSNYMDSVYLNSQALMFVCSGASASSIWDCVGYGGVEVLKRYSDLVAGDLLGTNCCGYDTPSSAYAPGSNGSSSSSSSMNPLGVPDLTETQWGNIVTGLLGLFVLAAIFQAFRKHIL